MQGVLFDMDGVLYNGNQPIPGGVESVRFLQQQSLPYLFCTNTSSRDRGALVEKLRGFGIDASEDEILTPARAAADWLRTSARGAVALFVRPSTRREFAGLDCLDDRAEHGAECVVIGDLGRHWDYEHLNRAFRLLYHNPQAELIALGMTRYWLAPEGISLDVAPFVAALQHAIGRQPVVFGKPAARFFHAAVEQLGLPPAEVLMVGDDVEADVGGAQEAGLIGALVKTGKFRPSDLEGSVRPDLVWESIADLPGWFAGANSRSPAT